MSTFVLVSLAMSQAAQVPTTVVQPQIEVVGPTRPRRICHMVQDTGSHIAGYRVCQTVDERNRELTENQLNAERAVRDTLDTQWGDQPFSQFALPDGTRVRRDEVQPARLTGPHN